MGGTIGAKAGAAIGTAIFPGVGTVGIIKRKQQTKKRRVISAFVFICVFFDSLMVKYRICF